MRLTQSFLAVAFFLAISCASMAGCRSTQSHAEPPARHSDARPMSANEIAKRVRHTREQLANLDVTYTFASASPLPANAIAWETRRVVLADRRMLVEREYGSRDSEGVTSIGGYDGKQFWLYRHSVRQAEISSDAAAMHYAIATEGSGFFDLMRWYPDHATCFGSMHHLDLLALIESPSARIRAEQESIDSRLCIVIDNLDMAGNIIESVWLDPTRSFLPIRQELRSSGECEVAAEPDHAGSGNIFRDFAGRSAGAPASGQEGVVTATFVIDEAREVLPGIWVPVAGRRLTETTRFEMNVQINDAGRHVLTTIGADTAEFNYRRHLPGGTMVFDLDTDQVSVTRR